MEASVAARSSVDDRLSVPSADPVAGTIQATARRRIGILKILLYALSTGDFNPIHFFSIVARRLGFPKRFAHGGLIQGIAKDLVRRDVAKSAAVKGKPMITKEDWEFKSPVYLHGVIFVEYTVRLRQSKDGTLARIKATVKCVTDDGIETVTEGTLCAVMKQ